MAIAEAIKQTTRVTDDRAMMDAYIRDLIERARRWNGAAVIHDTIEQDLDELGGAVRTGLWLAPWGW